MPSILEGSPNGAGRRLGVVAARFNDAITDRLLSAALDTLRRHGAADADIHVARVPGAFEIPLAVQEMARAGEVEAIIALGAVIRGATPHFDVLASQVTSSLAQIALVSSLPVAFGVLTCNSVEQAIERSGGKGGNKGAEAALVAIEMASLLPALRKGG